MERKHIEVIVPKKLLERFNRKVKENFTSRNEAIKTSMKLILDELEERLST
jgi:metal-responsive CopG/Arc/MetJ family transcriptional regulator